MYRRSSSAALRRRLAFLSKIFWRSDSRGRRDGADTAGGTPARRGYHHLHPMRVDHEKREIVCSVGDLVYESTYRRIGVERGDGFRRMWIGQDIHTRRAELRAATDASYRAESHVVHRIGRRGWGTPL